MTDGSSILPWINTAAFYAVMASWVVFLFAFILQKRPPKPEEQKRDTKANPGILLEAAGFAIVWFVRRPMDTSLLPGSSLVGLFTALLAVVIAGGSVWFTITAIRILGKQWAVASRIVQGHELITNGPYRRVRHPIYAGMFGMLIATGVVNSQFWAFAIAVVLFWYGTLIRIRSEEALLREAFGQEFEDYARSVPSLLPRLSSHV